MPLWPRVVSFTRSLASLRREGPRSKADRNDNRSVEVRELADYVEELLPQITRKRGHGQLPFSSTDCRFFTLVRRP